MVPDKANFYKKLFYLKNKGLNLIFRCLAAIWILFISISLNAQYSHTDVLKGLRDDILLQQLVPAFKTGILLDYNIARDTLFAKIDAVQDSLECIYTGLRLYLPPDQDPTQAVFLGGIANGINTEHVYPEAKGASLRGRSDMHHLFPSRIKTNSDRGNNPMGEIPDQETRIWYLRDTERSTPPPFNRDLYSESTPQKFEPREHVKGDIARAVFYFYTMYRQDADNADPFFFNIQRSDLCEWHYLDPVDQKEWERTHKIAFYQGDKPNPFVLDCSLAARLYCNNISQACEELVLSSSEDSGQTNNELTIYPNPSSGLSTIQWNVHSAGAFRIDIMDMFGRKLNQLYDGLLPEGQHLWQLPEGLHTGMYYIFVYNDKMKLLAYKKLQII